MKFALQMERQGCDYYTKAAQNAANPAARQMLLSLADDEKKHEQIITELMDGKIAKIEALPLKGVKNVFQQLVDQNQTFAAEDDLIKVCKEAAQVEKKSAEMYQQLADQSDNPQQKEIWLTIKKEEEKHLRLLTLTFDYADEPNMVLEDAEFLFYGHEEGQEHHG